MKLVNVDDIKKICDNFVNYMLSQKDFMKNYYIVINDIENDDIECPSITTKIYGLNNYLCNIVDTFRVSLNGLKLLPITKLSIVDKLINEMQCNCTIYKIDPPHSVCEKIFPTKKHYPNGSILFGNLTTTSLNISVKEDNELYSIFVKVREFITQITTLIHDQHRQYVRYLRQGSDMDELIYRNTQFILSSNSPDDIITFYDYLKDCISNYNKNRRDK